MSEILIWKTLNYGFNATLKCNQNKCDRDQNKCDRETGVCDAERVK